MSLPNDLLELFTSEYDKLENGAMGVSLYLKAADITEDKDLQYKSLIGIGLCYDRQRDRNHTSEGAFLDAAALLPERPEAHYHLCTIYEKMKSWKRLSEKRMSRSFSKRTAAL